MLGIPLVIGYNGRDHFALSCIMSPAEYNQWKLQILVKLIEASCEVIDDISSGYISPEISTHLASLKDYLTTTQALCSESALPAVAT